MLTPFTESGDVDWDALDALVDWYVDAGVSGLFPVSQSSEMYELTDQERLAVARRVVDRVDGDLPVVACGTFASDVASRAAFVDRMADIGVDAVVLVASMLCDAGAGEGAWLERATELVETTDAPLGLYECPEPYHRTLSAEATAELAETGRFRFLKDTTCDVGEVTGKVEAASGTPLRVYNANVPTLGETLERGAAGYSGIAANYYPDLLAWFCEHHRAPEAAEVDQFLTVADRAIHRKYPGLAKLYRQRDGHDLTTRCRVAEFAFEDQDYRIVDAIRERAAACRRSAGIGGNT